MIRVESITIRDFRGIRDLTLDFNGKSYAICGPNGTGKSGVVDALEFALTGKVARLSGEGKGDISLKQHAPHVDRRDDPAKARVTIRVTIPSLDKTVTIERSPKAPAAPTVTPSDPEILAVLRQVEAHPETVLSRRELIRYVLATPGKRAEEVQALLRLDEVEKVRVGLQKVANSCEKQVGPLGTVAVQARDNLLRALELGELTKDRVLAAANAQRATFGLPALLELTEKTSLKDGMTAQQPGQPQRVPRTQALADIQAARQALADVGGDATVTRVSDVAADVASLANDPDIAVAVTREAFYQAGVSLAARGACPFCDTPWDLAELTRNVRAKLDHLRDVALRRKAAETKLAPLTGELRKARAAIDALVGYAIQFAPPISVQPIRDYSATCALTIKRLEAFLPLPETIAALQDVPIVPPHVLEAIGRLEAAVSALPEPTKQDAAREWLTVAQERIEVWREAMRRQKRAAEQAQRARNVLDIYATTSNSVLSDIYSDVQNRFASLYAFVNRDDEDTFKAKLTPSLGKLGFDVDFYGRGFFPPGAYHSEGHQDSMGLCLYLALMRHLQGADFTFAVLDDVLMSVDAGHRREVCALLKREFSDTQFIMTTHDPVWLRHMKTEGLVGVRAAVQFKSWSVDNGPARWDTRAVWEEIDEHLAGNDVRAAAALLRNYLEYAAWDLCDRLHAAVGFRGDVRYELGELLPAAIARMRQLFRSAKKAANSWNQKDVVDEVADRESAFSALVEASNAEKWQVNAAVHFNAWANLCREDFAPVAKAYRDLLTGFSCSKCGGCCRVSPDRETPDSVRCDCGHTNINLRDKSK